MATATKRTTSNRSTTTPSNATSRASLAQVAQAKANAKANAKAKAKRAASAQAPAQATAQATAQAPAPTTTIGWAPAMGAPAPTTTPAASAQLAPAMGAPVPASAPKAVRYMPGPLPTHVQVVPGRGRYNAAGAANAYAALVASGGVVATYLANCAAYRAAGQSCNGPVPTLRYFLARGVCVAVAAPASVAQAS